MSIFWEKAALRADLRARLSQSDPAKNAACDVRITQQVLLLPAEWNDVPAYAVITEDGILRSQDKTGAPGGAPILH